MMAVAGGVTVAYVCRLDSGGRMDARGTSALRSSCCGVDDALTRLLDGRPALVAGGDMAALQKVILPTDTGADLGACITLLQQVGLLMTGQSTTPADYTATLSISAEGVAW